jgi:hypothetical protein
MAADRRRRGVGCAGSGWLAGVRVYGGGWEDSEGARVLWDVHFKLNCFDFNFHFIAQIV